MIQEWSHLFFRVDPFLRATVLDSFTLRDAAAIYSFRPVSLITDLKILYKWFNHPWKTYPGFLHHFTVPLLLHYKAILQSPDAQSFLLLENKREFAQVDIVPAQQDAIHLSYFMPPQSYIVHFLLADDTVSTVGEEAIFAFLLNIWRYENSSSLFVPIYAEDAVLREKITGFGFTEAATVKGPLAEIILFSLMSG